MRTIIAASALLSILGCSVESDVPAGDGDEDNDLVAGQYELTSTYDLSSSDALPGFLGDILGPLAGLADDPGGTLIDILEETDDSIADLLGLLPPAVRAELEQKINDFVAEQIAAGGAAGDIIAWADQVAGILTNFEVVSQFEIGFSDADGVARGNHKLTALRFELDDGVQQVDTPEIINTLTMARDVECQITGGEIDIAEHAFNLPLGELAVVGFNQALESSLGAANIGEALALVIDCADVAESVGPVCLGPVCLEIESMCNDGVTALASEIEGRIKAIDFAELRLTGGRAALEDAAKADGFPGQIDQWAGGTWNTNIAIDSLFSIPVDATFSATRL